MSHSLLNLENQSVKKIGAKDVATNNSFANLLSIFYRPIDIKIKSYDNQSNAQNFATHLCRYGIYENDYLNY